MGVPLPPLREREKKVLFAIRTWQHKKRFSPSVGDISEMFGVHKGTIGKIVSSLKAKGYLQVSQHKNWQRRCILFPEGTKMPWGNDELPDYLFDHLKDKPVNSNLVA
jgi:hypothetical protein